ncbi:MAG: hypothetical protein EOO66_03105 [Methylobacterium sp.]|nr:MAG: hypothetical protein EOO66_03105 [Methylobacterium sp.]
MTGLVSIPRELLSRPELQAYDRAFYLLWLTANAAPEEGLYWSGSTVVRLERGELVASHEGLAANWGVAGGYSRKVLDALRRAQAIDWTEATRARVTGMDAPAGTLFRIPWLADRDRLE